MYVGTKCSIFWIFRQKRFLKNSKTGIGCGLISPIRH